MFRCRCPMSLVATYLLAIGCSVGNTLCILDAPTPCFMTISINVVLCPFYPVGPSFRRPIYALSLLVKLAASPFSIGTLNILGRGGKGFESKSREPTNY